MLDGSVPWPEDLAGHYREAGYWRGEHLADLFRPWAQRDPGRTAVVAGDRRLSYGEMDTWAEHLALGFASTGLAAGDRVVVQLPNTPEFLAVCVALFRLGAIPVLALPAHRRHEIGFLCRHTTARAYIAADSHNRFDYRELARDVRAEVTTLKHVFVAGEAQEFTGLADVAEHGAATGATVAGSRTAALDPAEVAFFLLSGGTTGLPKLIPRVHQEYAYQLRETSTAMGSAEGDVYLAALPVGHNAALGCPGVLGAVYRGGTVVLASSPSPDEVFPLIAAEGVTLTTLMPSFLLLWAEMAELFDVDLSELVIEVGGARLSREDAAEASRRLGATLTRWFGMAEGVLSFTRVDDSEQVRLSTEGWPMSPGDELRVVDEEDRAVPAGEIGHLLVRGPCVLRGYYRSEEYNARAFTPDGFLRTGDLVRLTPERRLVVEGRVTDVVNRGGEKVPAEEVAGFIAGHPRVRDAAVVALPDRMLGELSCAVVIPHGEPPTLAEVREYLLGHGLAEYKLPDRLEVVTAFPRTSLGKLDKAELRAAVAG